jgi:hypothetical protein
VTPEKVSEKVNTPFLCKICGLDTENEDRLRLHRIAKHDDPKMSIVLACQYCNFEFDSQEELGNHTNEKHEGLTSTHPKNKYKCNYCIHTFGSEKKASWKNHRCVFG